MKYDLHSHSHYSDGTLSPAELVKAADEIGITHLALTDHDTVDGLVEANHAADSLDLTLINGVELSCLWEKQLLHVVGLNIDPNNEILRNGLAASKQLRVDRAEAMFEDLEQHDIDVRAAVLAQLEGRAVPTRPHFAQALVDQGYVKDKKRAFKQYLVRGKPGFIPVVWPSLEEIGAWVAAAGGVAVLAHPNRYKFTRSKLSRLIVEMIPAGINGIEVSTSTTDKQQSAMLGQLSLDFGLLASVGSDFHSPSQPWARLGAAAELDHNLNPVWANFTFN